MNLPSLVIACPRTQAEQVIPPPLIRRIRYVRLFWTNFRIREGYERGVLISSAQQGFTAIANFSVRNSGNKRKREGSVHEKRSHSGHFELKYKRR